jgi:hypothetical protein
VNVDILVHHLPFIVPNTHLPITLQDLGFSHHHTFQSKEAIEEKGDVHLACTLKRNNSNLKANDAVLHCIVFTNLLINEKIIHAQ